jgi:hypothetical protein
MFKKFIFVIVLVIGFAGSSFSQEDTLMPKHEAELVSLLSQLRSSKGNEAKEAANLQFKKKLEEVLETPYSMMYPFDQLGTMGSVRSSDNLVRLFNWNVEQDDLSQKYYCYILRYDQRKEEFSVNELIDEAEPFNQSPQEILEAKDWYGALYYQIIPFDKGSRTMYALLGWDGYTQATNRKLIDVLYFSGNNPKLGSPVFRVGKESFKRIFYEHSEKATMSLRFDEKNERILFDHLSPESPALKGFYAYYVPDMSYDAFNLKNGRWYLEEDVIAVNKAVSTKIDVQYPSDKPGEIKSSKLKNTWINPSDKNSPTAGTPHVARTPDGEVVETDPAKNSDKTKKSKEDKEKEKRIKKDKRDPSKMYPYSELKKDKKQKWWRIKN